MVYKAEEVNKKIEEYRYSERVRLTKEKRPDLLK